MSRKSVLVPLLLVVSAVLSGCNTIEGAGEDLESAGDAIEDEAGSDE